MSLVTHPLVASAVGLLAIRLLDLSTFWSGILLFLSLNLKMIPLASTIRVVPSLARLYLWPTSALAPALQADAQLDSLPLFHPYAMSSRACPLECDVNIHKSNSTYLLDLDVSRAELITRRLTHALRRSRAAFILGGVDISFRREIRPWEAYETRSCILTWDQKWVYILSYLVKPGAKVEGPAEGASTGETWDWVEALLGMGPNAQAVKSQVFAVAFSKYVAKAGRRTIAPVDLLEAGGYLTPREEEKSKRTEAKRTHGLRILQSKFGI